jgi:(E)-4-hydroxy-3-methylbut-2-enyl-diphosphate synthase
MTVWHAAHPFAYKRRRTRVVLVGSVAVGGDEPIRVQTMTTTDTMDTAATVAQVLRCAEAGSEIVRITAPSLKDARNLKDIKAALLKAGCTVPLVADIHFTPDAAMEAALHVEKVRVNPGNFADSKAFRTREYSDGQYAAELERIEARFTPLVLRCRDLGRAMRIGTNHGSLSDRIMNRFGDTPLGMVESALEFCRIARKNGYHALILSMKSSNPKVMIQAYRLLAARMEEEGMDYPFHLGVTEAGEGEDGRIKSAAGIGALLEDGLGDTIRVSLTEDPELEIPVAAEIARRYASRRTGQEPGGELASEWISRHPSDGYQRREAGECKLGDFNLHARSLVRVFTLAPFPAGDPESNLGWVKRYPHEHPNTQARPEILVFDVRTQDDLDGVNVFARHAQALGLPVAARFPLPLSLAEGSVASCEADMLGFRISGDPGEVFLGRLDVSGKALWLELDPSLLAGPSAKRLEGLSSLELTLSALERRGIENILLSVDSQDVTDGIHANRVLSAWMDRRPWKHPLLLGYRSPEDLEAFRVSCATLAGSLLCDGVGDAVCFGPQSLPLGKLDAVALAFNVLQAAQVRISKTEFISCPSCGRTLFDLQEVTSRIKKRTGHLTGVKIAIMGCIVNGPGEMADADFGYVGGVPGKVNLFVGKDCVERHIPFDQADDALVALIKKQGKWKDPVLSAPSAP